MMNSLRIAVKYIIVVFLYYTGLLWLWVRLADLFESENNFLILMYHRVLAADDSELGSIQPGLYVSTDVFEKQMAVLAGNFNPISLQALCQMLRDKKTIPPKSVILTFDDGWRDNYTHAFPVMRKYGIPATIFLTADFIESGKQFWFAILNRILSSGEIDRVRLKEITGKTMGNNMDLFSGGSDEIDIDGYLEFVKRLDPKIIEDLISRLLVFCPECAGGSGTEDRMLRWDEIKEMRRGNIEFGSHGCSHRILTNLESDDIKKELSRSKEIIEHKIGAGVTMFSYPNGNYNDEIADLARSEGYTSAVTTRRPKGTRENFDIFALERVAIHQGMSVSPRGKFSRAMFYFGIFRNRLIPG